MYRYRGEMALTLALKNCSEGAPMPIWTSDSFAALVWYKRLSACHWMARTTAGIAAKTMGAFLCPFNNRKTATMNGSVIASSFVAQASSPETAAAQYQSLRGTAS